MSEQDLLDKIKKLEDEVHNLEKDLIHDSLTSLKTRAFFEEESKTYIDILNNNKGKRSKWFGFKNLSFIFFDIDHFKKINDTYGHPVGDEVLRDVAEVIKNSVREGDTVARLGGEEMVASILGANEKDALEKAESIRKKIESLTFKSTPDLKVTVSAGVASSFPNVTYEELLKNADLALYKAKETGRNKTVVYSEI